MPPSQPSSTSQPGSNANKSADYVFFERTTTGFSDEAVPRAKTAQLKLEHYYKVAVDAAIERNTRCVCIRQINEILIDPLKGVLNWNAGLWGIPSHQRIVSSASFSNLGRKSRRFYD
jgi:hypothetical protein